MKALQVANRDPFKIVLTIFLIANLAFTAAPRAVAVEGQASISVHKTVGSVTVLPRGFGIDKSVDESAITLNRGDSSEVVYTISVTRTESEAPSYEVTGTITATNTSNENAALVTKVEDAIEYHAGGQNWVKVNQVTVHGEDSIDASGSETYDYEITFTPPEGIDEFHNVAYVYISNRGGEHPEEPYLERVSFDLPEEEENGPTQVRMSDVESLTPDDGGVGYEVTSVSIGDASSSDLLGPWEVTPPETITIHKTVTASASATPGTYTLHNIAAIVEGPSDSTDVTITVPSPPSNDGGGQSSGGGGEQSSSGGGGSSSSNDQGGASTTSTVEEPAPTFSPEQVVVAPAVVTQPSSSPETVAQVQSTDLPARLPFTGVSYWYLASAMLLIATGLLLQTVRYRPQHLRKARVK